MSKSTQIFSIDEFLKAVIKEYILFIVCILISIISSYFYVNNLEKKYQSKIELDLLIGHPFLDDEYILKIFEDNFYTFKNFETWSNNYSSNLVFESIANSTNSNNFEYQKSINDMLVIINKENILINSNDSKIIGSIYSYLEFINNLTISHLLVDINNVEIANLISNDTTKILFYNEVIKNKKKVFSLSRPSFPELTYPIKINFYFISLILGMLLSLIIIFLKNNFHKKILFPINKL